MELGKKCFLRVGPERGAADPAQTILLAANHETMEVKVAPISSRFLEVEAVSNVREFPFLEFSPCTDLTQLSLVTLRLCVRVPFYRSNHETRR
jgi:hypothetical protein